MAAAAKKGKPNTQGGWGDSRSWGGGWAVGGYSPHRMQLGVPVGGAGCGGMIVASEGGWVGYKGQ